MNWFQKLIGKTPVAPVVLPEKVRNELAPPFESDEYPKKCLCGSASFHLIHDGNEQLQRCAECRRRYRSILVAKVMKHKCPDCGGQLYEGPSGGAAMNIYCDKQHRFWFAAPFGHFIVERLK